MKSGKSGVTITTMIALDADHHIVAPNGKKGDYELKIGQKSHFWKTEQDRDAAVTALNEILS